MGVRPAHTLARAITLLRELLLKPGKAPKIDAEFAKLKTVMSDDVSAFNTSASRTPHGGHRAVP